jgi:DNA-binding MarR family transcriptional regulator
MTSGHSQLKAAEDRAPRRSRPVAAAQREVAQREVAQREVAQREVARREAGPDPVPQEPAAQLYREMTRLIERMHRRLLDVVRIELTRRGIDDVSPVQVLMLLNVGNEEVSVRDLIERGYYLASNASYNLKALLEAGYIDRTTALRDKRAARIRLSEKGQALCAALAELETFHAARLMEDEEGRESFECAFRVLRQLELTWSDAIRYDDRQFL